MLGWFIFHLLEVIRQLNYLESGACTGVHVHALQRRTFFVIKEINRPICTRHELQKNSFLCVLVADIFVDFSNNIHIC